MQFQADILGIPVGVLLSSMLLPGAAFGAVWLWVLADYSALVAGRRINRIFLSGRGAASAR